MIKAKNRLRKLNKYKMIINLKNQKKTLKNHQISMIKVIILSNFKNHLTSLFFKSRSKSKEKHLLTRNKIYQKQILQIKKNSLMSYHKFWL
jgi:hypothetical protein